MKWEQKDNLKNLISFKKENQHMEVKIHGLTEGLNCIQEDNNVNQEVKLKKIIFILLRENKELKNQIHLIERSSQNF